MKPLSPSEVIKKSEDSIPDFVIEAVNNLLVKECHSGRIILKQKDIEREILRINPGVCSDVLYTNHWMDFESLFRAVGWNVTYDKPGYNETYAPTYIFRNNIKLYAPEDLSC